MGEGLLGNKRKQTFCFYKERGGDIVTIKEIAAATGVNYERYEGYKKALEENGGIHTDEDYYAMDAMEVFESQKIRVPEDVSVAGFDDNTYAKRCHPKLTTIIP